MARVAQADGRQAGGTRLGDGDLRPAAGHHLPEPAPAVHHRGDRRLARDGDVSGGVDLALADPLRILRDADHPVGIVTAEVRPDEKRGDPARVVRRAPERCEDARGRRLEPRTGDDRHVRYDTRVVGPEREFFDHTGDDPLPHA